MSCPQPTESGYQYGDLKVSGLPRRLSSVLLLRAAGKSIRHCALTLHCSEANIKQAVSELFYKLRVDSTPELLITAMRKGYLEFRSIFLVAVMCLLSAIQICDQGINARAGRNHRTQTTKAQRSGRNKNFLIDIEEIC